VKSSLHGYFCEVRQRSLRVLLFFCILFAIFFYSVNHLFNFVIHPLLLILPKTNFLVATTITGPAFAQLNLAVNFALFFSIPFCVYQLWKFICPALYQKEVCNMRRVVIYCGSLFIIGSLSCYFLILPMIFKFLIGAVPENVKLMPDINYTIDFIFRMMLVFGLCFQLPLIMLVLVRSKIMCLTTMKYYRSHFIVIAFIIGMIFTPPDVFSQVMLAVPMVILYELGLLFASKNITLLKS
jgi:sec-independent protein translocase protein TatC